MLIKTLADVSKQSTSEKTMGTKATKAENTSPYFEDDPAYQEFLDTKPQGSLERKQYRPSSSRPRRKKTKNISNTPVSSTSVSNKRLNQNSIKGVKEKIQTVYKKRKNTAVYSKNQNTRKATHQRNNVAPPPILDIKAILQEVKADEIIVNEVTVDELSHQNKEGQQQNHSTDKSIDNVTAKLAKGLKTDEQRQAEIDEIKGDRRLRWLAFYYLSTREHSAKELKDKLLAKEQDPDKIDALLVEFAENGYQSDMRTAFMVIREGIRKGRGRRRIEQDCYKRKIAVPNNIDELIELANEESAEFVDFVGEQKEVVNWLKLAVEVRVKKYGDDIPTDNKDKAKQLRFLQYRGFQSDICFEALRHDLESIQDL